MVFPKARHIETNLVRKLRRRDHFCDPPFCAHAHSDPLTSSPRGCTRRKIEYSFSFAVGIKSDELSHWPEMILQQR
jgi:hypothetical protein